MTTVKVKFTSLNDVSNFVNRVSKFDTDMDIKRGHAVLDGKSLEGLFALEMNRELDCIIHDDMCNIPELMEAIKEFTISDFSKI